MIVEIYMKAWAMQNMGTLVDIPIRQPLSRFQITDYRELEILNKRLSPLHCIAIELPTQMLIDKIQRAIQETREEFSNVST